MVLQCSNCGFQVEEEVKFCSQCGASANQPHTEKEVAELSFCWKCGTRLPKDNGSFCSNCGTSIGESLSPSIHGVELASWGDRFFAWLIDLIVIGIFLSPIKLFLVYPGFVWAPSFIRWIPFVDFGLDNLVYFFYWVMMDGTYGQSIGKMALRLRVTRPTGDSIDIGRAAIESIGKAFLLPVDCIVGWILYQERGQRLFNYISDTIVVKFSR